jgi:hypothetical protein
MVELALQSHIEVAKEMPVLFLLAGLASPQRKPPISGTLTKKIPTSYKGKIRECKLWKRNNLIHDRLVAGPNPTKPTYEIAYFSKWVFSLFYPWQGLTRIYKI